MKDRNTGIRGTDRIIKKQILQLLAAILVLAARDGMAQIDTNSVTQKAASSELREYVKKMRQDPSYEWKLPINFFGRVVDDGNKPVADANVHFQWVMAKGDGISNEKLDIRSDESGLFELRNKKGDPLQVSVSKQGYYSENEYFWYSPDRGPFRPDQNNPFVFRLHKKGAGVDLIQNLKLFGFRTNGPVQYLDLVEGKNKLTPPGDLVVQFTRGVKNAAGKYDWSATISVPDGGLYETNEEFMFVAPEEGYQPSIEIHYNANDSDWHSYRKEKFYFKSRNGSIYGWAEAKIIPNYQNGAAIDLDYYINPSGSRNLEPK